MPYVVEFFMNMINMVLILQVNLGIITVLTGRLPQLTSLHVFTGAFLLGLSYLFLLRIIPINFHNAKMCIFPKN